MSKLKVKVIRHHEPKEDPDCDMDHCGISLLINDKCVTQYGDEYHDKSSLRVESQLSTIEDLGYELDKTYESIADAVQWMAPEMKMHKLIDVLFNDKMNSV